MNVADQSSFRISLCFWSMQSCWQCSSHECLGNFLRCTLKGPIRTLMAELAASLPIGHSQDKGTIPYSDHMLLYALGWPTETSQFSVQRYYLCYEIDGLYLTSWRPCWKYNTKDYVINLIVGSGRRGWLTLSATSREIDCKPRLE